MKVQPTDKESIRARMVNIAKVRGENEKAREIHRFAVGQWFMDLLEIKGDDREKVLGEWMKCPPAFGTNDAAFQQYFLAKDKSPELVKSLKGI